MNDPTITINGQMLTTDQAKAVHCAITSFAAEMIFAAEMMEDGGRGDDKHKIRMADVYRDRLNDVLKIILR